MNVLAAFLARHAATNADGTFDVKAGGVTEFHPQGQPILIGRPYLLHPWIVVRLQCDAKEAARLHWAQVAVHFEDQRVATSPRLPVAFRLPENEPRSFVNLIGDMPVLVPRLGRGYVQFTVDDMATPLMHFTLRLPPAPI